MNNMDRVFKVLAVLGVLTAMIALAGRFFKARTVFGGIIPDGGMAASSVMIGANTILLLAIVIKLMDKKE